MNLVALVAGMTYREAAAALECVQVAQIAPDGARKPRGGMKYPSGLRGLYGLYSEYLRGRGLDSDVVGSLWGAMSGGSIGRLAWRIWIPIRNAAGVDVSWTARAIGGREPRYISASPEEEAVDHKSLLYGEDLAGHAIVVVEGPLDAWRIGPGAVATLGLQVTPEQVSRIGGHPVRAICFDRERAALRRADKLASLLAQSPGDTYVVELETGDDPADADDEEVDEIRRKFLDQCLTGRGGML